MSKKVYLVMRYMHYMGSYYINEGDPKQGNDAFCDPIVCPERAFTKREDAVEYIRTYNNFMSQEHLLGFATYDAAELNNIYKHGFDPRSGTRDVIGVTIDRTKGEPDRVATITTYHLQIEEIELNE